MSPLTCVLGSALSFTRGAASVPNIECFGEGRGGYEVSPMSSPNSVETSARMRSAARALAKGLIEEGARAMAH